jgi:hypothetical protein
VNATDRHYSRVARQLVDGEVIPFLGAGANLCDRPDEALWQAGVFTPSGRELARALAEEADYPHPDDPDLLRVSQYVDAVLGLRPLYRRLHEVFDADYPPTSLHRLLARVAVLLRDRGGPQLIVLTTNYDDLTERAFDEAGVPFDVLWYEAKPGPLQGCFWHRPPPPREVVAVDIPNKYVGLADERPVVLKLHGAIDRDDETRDSYVVTEDSYIDYLSGRDVGEQIPVDVRARLADSHFLFLGYSMRDWNLRVILNRIWGAQQLDSQFWAVQREPDDPAVREIEETLWRRRTERVELHYLQLRHYAAGLAAALDAVAGT